MILYLALSDILVQLKAPKESGWAWNGITNREGNIMGSIRESDTLRVRQLQCNHKTKAK